MARDGCENTTPPRTIVACGRVACKRALGGGGGTPGVRANEGVDKGEICMNSSKFAPKSHEIRTKFVRIQANSCLWIGYRLAGFCHVLFWAPFGHGGCVWAGTFTG